MNTLEKLRATLAANLADRAAQEARVDTIITAVETRADGALTDTETAEIGEARTAIATLDAARGALVANLAEVEARAEARKAADELAARYPSPSTSSAGGRITVGQEERTYRPGGAHSFLADLYARDTRKGDVRGAEDRLNRHETEILTEKRATVVAGMAGAIPPQYLLDQYTPVARAGRPFLNSLNSQQLPPDGVSFFIPKGTTGTSAAVVTEGSGFNDSDLVVGNDNPMVQLIGVKSDVSRTLFERGGYVVDSVIFPDLYAACDVTEDNIALTGTSASTSFLGALAVASINVVAFTTASPTVALAWPKFSDAIQRINSLRFSPATAIFMHPRRWGWITSAVDTQGRPLFNFTTQVSDDPYYALGTAKAYGQIVGTLQGLPVITDANIPTTYASGVPGAGTEDVILIARTTDFLLWEDEVLRFSFEQAPATAPGQVRLAVGRFALFHAGRYPKGISIIAGTGLVAPTF